MNMWDSIVKRGTRKRKGGTGTQRKKRKSLKWKMIRCTLSLLVIAILVIMFIAIYISRKGLLDNVQMDLKSMGKTVSENITAQLESSSGKVDGMATSIEGKKSMSDQEKFNFLNAKKSAYQLQSIGLITPAGKLITDSKELTSDSLDKALLDTVKKDGKAYGEPMKTSDGKLISLVFAENNEGYIVVAIWDGEYYTDLVSEYSFGKTGKVFVVDKTGTMIANSDTALVENQVNFIQEAKENQEYQGGADLCEKLIAEQTGIKEFSYNGESKTCYYTPISGTDGWGMVLEVPTNEMISSIYEIIITIVIASVILLLLGTLRTIVFAGRMIRPVAAIQERIELLAKGDIHTPLSLNAEDDEIGAMAESMKVTLSELSMYIQDLERCLEKLAAGELDVKPAVAYVGDFKGLEMSLQVTIGKLNTLIHQVTDSAAQVATGADQVAASAQVLAQGAAEQASSMEELSSAAQGITENVAQNAEHAGNADTQMHQLDNELTGSNRKMSDMLSAMQEISSASDGIGKIIKTIEDIAFQTNILALNAAVEAARAGESGKGFAVVADEVGNLAGKSAEAAKSVSQLIINSQIAVRRGTDIASETAQSLEQATGHADAIVESIQEIAAVSNQQSIDICEISQGLNQISAVVETNSSTSEESASASEELSEQASRLIEMMQQFHLADET